MGSAPSELSIVRVTSARPNGARPEVPAKMTSSILPPRRSLAPCVPRMQRRPTRTADAVVRGITESGGLATDSPSASDESRRGRLYIVAAVLVPPGRLHRARGSLRELRLRGQRRVHFKTEQTARQHLILSALARLELPGRLY